MALLLAPYNHAMRIGQGFNSYTQQICIDDAVVLNPDRKPNTLSNDGWTMKDLSEAMKNVGSDRIEEAEQQKALDLEYQEALARWDVEHAKYEAAARQALPDPSSVDTTAIEQHIADEKQSEQLPDEKQKAEDDRRRNEQRARDAANPDEVRASVSGKSAAGLLLQKPTRKYAYYQSQRRAPGQNVTYTSRFIQKVSDITDDMNISGSLSIKYNMIGGSGSGSFIDTNKIMDSDLNFYISVKVVNHTLNEVDSLKFSPLKSVNVGGRKESDETFQKIYGDSFISGFLEGGEFNAVVSMKVLNEEKKMDIAASAKVALTAGPLELNATAKVNIAKENLRANTETTIQVSWRGGGHLKNSEDAWDMDTLMEVASRFPDLVATTPQRTYAILTKYDALRSFREGQAETFTPLQYDNAAVYTNAMLDSYMEYKNMYSKIGEAISGVESGLLQLEASTLLAGMPSGTSTTSGDSLELVPQEKQLDNKTYKQDFTLFPVSIAGLDLGRQELRKQMARIVQEVDAVTVNPTIAVDVGRSAPFQMPATFKARLPVAKPKRPVRKTPLAVSKISLDDEEEGMEAPEAYAYLADDRGKLEDKAAALYKRIMSRKPTIGRHLQMGLLQGRPLSSVSGMPSTVFNNLEFIDADFAIQRVGAQIVEGALGYLTIQYSNGMATTQGTLRSSLPQVDPLEVEVYRGERIISCSIELGVKVRVEAGKDGEENPSQVTSLLLHTNRGKSLRAYGAPSERTTVDGKDTRMGVAYEKLKMIDLDPQIENGHLKGFWGYGIAGPGGGHVDGIYALAPIWGDVVV